MGRTNKMKNSAGGWSRDCTQITNGIAINIYPKALGQEGGKC